MANAEFKPCNVCKGTGKVKNRSFGVHDLIGKRFGKWIVTAIDARKRWGWSYICTCDCGNTNSVNRYALRGGRSLGCRPCSARAREALLRSKKGIPQE